MTGDSVALCQPLRCAHRYLGRRLQATHGGTTFMQGFEPSLSQLARPEGRLKEISFCWLSGN